MIKSFPKLFLLAFFVQIFIAETHSRTFSDIGELKQYPVKDVHSGTPSGYYVFPIEYNLNIKADGIDSGNSIHFRFDSAIKFYPIHDVDSETDLFYNGTKIAICRYQSRYSRYHMTVVYCIFTDEITKFEHVEGSFDVVVSFDDGLMKDDFMSDRNWTVGVNEVVLRDYDGTPLYKTKVELTAVDSRGSDFLVRYLGDSAYYFSIRSPEITCDKVLSVMFSVTTNYGELNDVGIFMFSSVNPFGRPTNVVDIPNINEFKTRSQYTATFPTILKGHRLFVYGNLIKNVNLIISYGFDVSCTDAELELHDSLKFESFQAAQVPEAKEFSKIPFGR